MLLRGRSWYLRKLEIKYKFDIDTRLFLTCSLCKFNVSRLTSLNVGRAFMRVLEKNFK